MSHPPTATNRDPEGNAMQDRLLQSKSRRWRASFAWYDLWVGAFYDRAKRVLYVCPVPCLLIEWRRP